MSANHLDTTIDAFIYPDSERFVCYREMAQQADQAARRAEQEAQRAAAGEKELARLRRLLREIRYRSRIMAVGELERGASRLNPRAERGN